ncbi:MULTISPECIES: hypothetical protein [Aminobacterium]|jgi:ABC-type proline/glycine betaine transport system permease subunit|uniref:hypothetical protein n=1 Tax=Aminobacterium TaxID=81466 RepID=UPI00257C687F|nr:MULTISPECIES: hypothetical protein [unclassified Aminobacterium]
MKRIIFSMIILGSLFLGAFAGAWAETEKEKRLTLVISAPALEYMKTLPAPLYLDWGYYRGA